MNLIKPALLIFSGIILVFVLPAIDSCPLFYLGHKDNCYKPFHNKLNAIQADQMCRKDGGYLAKINDEEDAEFLQSFVRHGYFLIGAHYFDNQMIWNDFSPVNWTQWWTNASVPKNLYPASPAPVDKAIHCVGLTFDMKLASIPCSNQSRYICMVENQSKPPVPLENGCPYNYSLYKDNCYKVYTKLRSFKMAEKHCRLYGGNLASVNNYAEHSYILHLVRDLNISTFTKNIWTGGHYFEKNFKWIDGTEVTYTNWTVHEPTPFNDKFKCISQILERGGQWGMLTCTSKQSYVCKNKHVTDKLTVVSPGCHHKKAKNRKHRLSYTKANVAVIPPEDKVIKGVADEEKMLDDYMESSSGNESDGTADVVKEGTNRTEEKAIKKLTKVFE